MDFTVLEARKYVSTCTTIINREVKDYEIDVECTDGRIYSYNSVEHQLSFGDILVRKPHDIASTIGEQNSYILTLDFSGQISQDLYSRNTQETFQPICKYESILRLEPIIHPTHVNEVISIYQKLISLPDRNSLIAKELIHQLIYTINAEISKRNYTLLKSGECVSETIIAYMQDHLDRNITLDELSKLAHLEKSYLVRLFRSETGKTPIELLIEMRLTKASDLVATSDLSIYEIATLCGYNTVSFFISKYKQRYGMTPAVHRRVLKRLN